MSLKVSLVLVRIILIFPKDVGLSFRVDARILLVNNYLKDCFESLDLSSL